MAANPEAKDQGQYAKVNGLELYYELHGPMRMSSSVARLVVPFLDLP
jgi:hypothetical protein